MVTPGTILFDSRSYYLQGGLNMTYQQTARTSYTIGGQGFEIWRQSPDLIGMEGYSLQGLAEHKLSRYTSVGFSYQRQHYNFPKVFGQADVDTGELFLGTNFGQYWTFTIHGGVFHSGSQRLTGGDPESSDRRFARTVHNRAGVLPAELLIPAAKCDVEPENSTGRA